MHFRRILITGALTATALVVVAAPASAGCSLSLVHCLDITISPGALSLGTANSPATTATSSEQIVRVESTKTWGMRIKTDIASGRPTEWNGTGYVGSPRILGSPLQWGLTSIAAVAHTPSWTNLSSTSATVVSGRASNCVLTLVCVFTDIGVKLRQAFAFSDRRADPNTYRVLVTYEAAHDW